MVFFFIGNYFQTNFIHDGGEGIIYILLWLEIVKELTQALSIHSINLFRICICYYYYYISIQQQTPTFVLQVIQ